MSKVAQSAKVNIGFAILLMLTPHARSTVISDDRHILFTVITVANKTEIGATNVTKDFLQPTDEGYHIFETSVATNTNLQEVTDTSLLKKAEAKYESDMKKIDLKDRKYDSDLAALDAERNAIKQEMETLKTVAKENVERTFKLFS